MEAAKKERCEFMPFMNPKKVIEKNGRIYAMKFNRTEVELDGKMTEDPDQEITIKTDFIISAFGSLLSDNKGEKYFALYKVQNW